MRSKILKKVASTVATFAMVAVCMAGVMDIAMADQEHYDWYCDVETGETGHTEIKPKDTQCPAFIKYASCSSNYNSIGVYVMGRHGSTGGFTDCTQNPNGNLWFTVGYQTSYRLPNNVWTQFHPNAKVRLDISVTYAGTYSGYWIADYPL